MVQAGFQSRGRVKPALPDVAKFISNLSAKLDGTSGRLFLVLYNSCILFDFWF